jgi:hypothetical protein
MNKLLYFTTCYVRDLPYANRLFGSMKKYTSDIDFVVVLIDEEGNIPTNFDYDFRILSMNSINREILTELSNRYNWDELKNNCKPFVFSHLLKEERQVIYLDCSTVIHQSVDIFDKTLASHNAFVVPQLLFAHQHPKENDALNFGVFHNGCMGFNASETTDKWIEWWQNHTRFKGYFDPCKGMNTDRLCLEFAPIFFKNTHVLKHPGVNMGNWNKPERKNISQQEIITTNYTDLPKSKLLSVVPEYGIPVPELSYAQWVISPKLKKVNQRIDDFFNRYYVYAQD